MNTPTENESADLPIIEPDADATYTLELVAELAGVSSQTILHYQEEGLIAPVAAGESEVPRFDNDALRTLRRLEHLRDRCGMNASGLRLMLALMDEIEGLRAALRARR